MESSGEKEIKPTVNGVKNYLLDCLRAFLLTGESQSSCSLKSPDLSRCNMIGFYQQKCPSKKASCTALLKEKKNEDDRQRKIKLNYQEILITL